MSEVVCGVQFRPLTQFEAPHYGLFWQTIRRDFPRSRTVPPLTTPIEIQPNQSVEISLAIGGSPDLPRVWFISEDDTSLVQLQPDRFLFNWREGKDRASYPRYKTIVRRFRSLFSKFRSFLQENELGEPALLQTELSYINQLRPDALWGALSDVGEIFPDLAWRREPRFLPPPKGLSFRSTHDLSAGQLIVTIQSGKEPSGQVVRFDLTARGSAVTMNESDLWQWYDQANIWIVDAFIDLTSETMQRENWMRVK